MNDNPTVASIPVVDLYTTLRATAAHLEDAAKALRDFADAQQHGGLITFAGEMSQHDAKAALAGCRGDVA